MSRIYAASHELDYRWIGPGPDNAPAIVFLHEGLGCVEMWRDFPEHVGEDTSCGALVYSRAGYGKSDPITLPRPVQFMHDEALEVLPSLLDAFEIREAILFGHSDGGSISLIYAGSVDDSRIKGLVLEAPHVFVETLGIESIKKAKQNYELGSLKNRLLKYHGDNVECAFRGWNDVWLNPDFRCWNIESLLPNIKVPVLVLQGEDDEYGTQRQVEIIRDSCNGPVETTIFPHCGHSPHRDHPLAVRESVKNFVRKILNTRRETQ